MYLTIIWTAWSAARYVLENIQLMTNIQQLNGQLIEN